MLVAKPVDIKFIKQYVRLSVHVSTVTVWGNDWSNNWALNFIKLSNVHFSIFQKWFWAFFRLQKCLYSICITLISKRLLLGLLWFRRLGFTCVSVCVFFLIFKCAIFVQKFLQKFLVSCDCEAYQLCVLSILRLLYFWQGFPLVLVHITYYKWQCL